MPKIFIVHYEEDPEATVQFRMTARDYWTSHVTYIGRAIVSIMADLSDVSVIADHLNKTAEDIGQLLVPYYTADDAMTLTNLIKEHVAIGVNLVRAVRAGSSTTTLATQNLANATAIATFLDSLDSVNWPKDTVLTILTAHLACTTRQAVTRAAGDWTGSIAAFDECWTGILTLADAFSMGIVDKFPEQFIKYEEYTGPVMAKKTEPKKK